MTTLLVTTPFSVDEKTSIVSGKLHILGGVIKDTATNQSYVVHEKAKLSLPFLTNYIYYNIKMKKYLVYKDAEQDNKENKLLFGVPIEVVGNVRKITEIRNLSASSLVPADELANITKIGAYKTYREENISLYADNGKIITLKYTPIEINLVSIEYTYNGEKVPFGLLDLENIDSLVNKNIELKLNLVRYVSRALGFIVENLILDITYTY